MSCRRARGLLVDYVFDEMERSGRAAFESHLDGCPRCRRHAAALKRLWRALPEPYPAALTPPAAVWERTWEAIAERIAAPLPADWPAQRPIAAWRWAAAAAALGGAFLLGRYWDEARLASLRLAGRAAPPAGYFSGLDTFHTASHGYLQRSRLLLLELQQTAGAEAGVDDPWLVSHSRSLLGEVPEHLSAARQIRNPHLEDLLADLEVVLRQVLESDRARGGLPRDLEAEMGLLLFKLEMLESPAASAAPGDGRPVAL